MSNKFSLGAALLVGLCLSFLSSCDSNDDKQISKPVILMNTEDAFPKNCVTVYRGETMEFKATFTDERELGNFNIEIHNNFDHHSHSTEGEECEHVEHKEPVDPFVYNKDFSIPSGQVSYNASITIDIPKDKDTGSYHFMVRVTNKAGWQEIKGISILIADR